MKYYVSSAGVPFGIDDVPYIMAIDKNIWYYAPLIHYPTLFLSYRGRSIFWDRLVELRDWLEVALAEDVEVVLP